MILLVPLTLQLFNSFFRLHMHMWCKLRKRAKGEQSWVVCLCSQGVSEQEFPPCSAWACSDECIHSHRPKTFIRLTDDSKLPTKGAVAVTGEP